MCPGLTEESNARADSPPAGAIPEALLAPNQARAWQSGVEGERRVTGGGENDCMCADGGRGRLDRTGAATGTTKERQCRQKELLRADRHCTAVSGGDVRAILRRESTFFHPARFFSPGSANLFCPFGQKNSDRTRKTPLPRAQNRVSNEKNRLNPDPVNGLKNAEFDFIYIHKRNPGGWREG